MKHMYNRVRLVTLTKSFEMNLSGHGKNAYSHINPSPLVIADFPNSFSYGGVLGDLISSGNPELYNRNTIISLCTACF